MLKGIGLVFLIVIVFLMYMCSQGEQMERAHQARVDEAKDPTTWVRELIDDGNSRNVAVEVKGGTYRVTYLLDSELGEDHSGVWSHEYNVMQLVKGGFTKFKDMKRLEVVAMVTLTNVKGHDKVVQAIRTVFTKKNAATVNWDNVRLRNMPSFADVWWEHPTMADEHGDPPQCHDAC